MRTSKRRQGQDSTLKVERLFIPGLCPLQASEHSPTRSPQGGRGMAAKRGQDQRIVCACCRRLRPRLRSVSSRLTVCARCYRCVLDKPTEVGAVAKEFGRREIGLMQDGPDN